MAQIDDDIQEDGEEDIMEMATDIALAALTGLLASGMDTDVAAAHAWIAPEHFLRERNKWMGRMVAIYGGGS